MMKLYDFVQSGNCYKVRLLLSHLGMAYHRIPIDRVAGETRLPEFMQKNPNGKIPLLELESGEYLPESNAILFYLAEGTKFLPSDSLGKTRALQWMFFEQSSHMPNLGVARYWIAFMKKEEEFKELLVEKHKLGYMALDVMEDQLKQTPFLAGKNYSVADISLYAYTHMADMGKFDLSRYPAILAWLARVKAQPGFVRLEDAAPGVC